jgi:hypothetical protein
MANTAAIDQYMKNRLEDPEKAIFYYNAVASQFSVSAELRKLPNNAIIYAHSFTDSQMENGFDGFKSVYDWLVFTLDILEGSAGKTNIFLKAHPSFFSETNERGAEVLDRELWKLLESEIPKNVHIINSTVTNWEFLQQFDPESTVLISHHGNAVVEGAYLGFRSISSVASPWGTRYHFSSTWASRREYAKILGEWNHGSSMTPESHFGARKFISDVYLSESSSISSNSYLLNVISRHCGISEESLRLSPFSDPEVDNEARNNAVGELAAGIKVLS